MRPLRIVAAIASLSFLPIGCGGIERDNRAGDAGIGEIGYGGFPSMLPAESGGGPSAPGLARCGDGVLDVGETCDGTQFGGATCASETMGTRPSGGLRCTQNCLISTASCLDSSAFGGATGAGGTTNHGGLTGAGGVTGFGGNSACYADGGVPFPPGSCTTGVAAQKACFGAVSGTQVGSLTCQENCGCIDCPTVYARCAADGACNWLLPCAVGVGCASMEACYQNGCGTITDTAGGLQSIGAVLADAALSCLWQTGCAQSCTSLN